MEEIKCIHEIRNGWLVVVRKGEKYIKIDDILVGKSGGYLDVEEYRNGLKISTYSEQLEDYDIVEVWKMRYKDTTLSFDLEDRKLVWKEQEQKYYMTGREYQELARVTQNLKLDKTQQLLNGCCGLAGESGEVIDIVKKYAFQGHDLDAEHIKEELGDVMWYIALLCNVIGVDLSEVMNENIQKLKRRYPQGFDSDKSVNREVEE